MSDVHSSLHANQCYWQGIMIQLKVHCKISIATAHRAWNTCKANFQSCENNAVRVQKHSTLHNDIIAKDIGESAVD